MQSCTTTTTTKATSIEHDSVLYIVAGVAHDCKRSVLAAGQMIEIHQVQGSRLHLSSHIHKLKINSHINTYIHTYTVTWRLAYALNITRVGLTIGFCGYIMVYSSVSKRSYWFKAVVPMACLPMAHW